MSRGVTMLFLLVLTSVCLQGVVLEQSRVLEQRKPFFERFRRLEEQFRRFQELTLTRLQGIAENYNISYNIDARFHHLLDQQQSLTEAFNVSSEETQRELNGIKIWLKQLQKKSKKMDLKISSLEGSMTEKTKQITKDKKAQDVIISNLTTALNGQKRLIVQLVLNKNSLQKGLEKFQEIVQRQGDRIVALEEQLRGVAQNEVLPPSALTASKDLNRTPQKNQPVPPENSPGPTDVHQRMAKLQTKHSQMRRLHEQQQLLIPVKSQMMQVREQWENVTKKMRMAEEKNPDLQASEPPQLVNKAPKQPEQHQEQPSKEHNKEFDTREPHQEKITKEQAEVQDTREQQQGQYIREQLQEHHTQELHKEQQTNVQAQVQHIIGQQQGQHFRKQHQEQNTREKNQEHQTTEQPQEQHTTQQPQEQYTTEKPQEQHTKVQIHMQDIREQQQEGHIREQIQEQSTKDQHQEQHTEVQQTKEQHRDNQVRQQNQDPFARGPQPSGLHANKQNIRAPGTICNVDSMLVFPNSSTENFVTFEKGLRQGLHEFSICSWVRTNASYLGTILSYATDENDNKLVLYGRDAEAFDAIHFVIGDPVFRELPVLAFLDGNWHHTCFIWSSIQGKFWYYVDRRLVSTGSRFQKGYEIPSGGSLVLGQEQDTLGGGFDSSEAFVGYLAGFAMWSRALSPGEVSGIATGKGLPRGTIFTLADASSLNGFVQRVNCSCLEHCL